MTPHPSLRSTYLSLIPYLLCPVMIQRVVLGLKLVLTASASFSRRLGIAISSTVPRSVSLTWNFSRRPLFMTLKGCACDYVGCNNEATCRAYCAKRLGSRPVTCLMSCVIWPARPSR